MNLIFQTIIVASFVNLTFADLKLAYFKDLNFGFGIDLLPAKLAALYNHPFVVGDVFGNLPGRMVALTFGMVATTYYANILPLFR